MTALKINDNYNLGSERMAGEEEQKKEPEEYHPKRGDIVELRTSGNAGIVAGWVDSDLIYVIELGEKREPQVLDIGDVDLLAKAEELENILPKQVELQPNRPS